MLYKVRYIYRKKKKWLKQKRQTTKATSSALQREHTLMEYRCGCSGSKASSNLWIQHQVIGRAGNTEILLKILFVT